MIEEKSKYDVIYIDACYNHEVKKVTCPIEPFTHERNLKLVKQALTKNGLFINICFLKSSFLTLFAKGNCFSKNNSSF